MGKFSKEFKRKFSFLKAVRRRSSTTERMRGQEVCINFPIIFIARKYFLLKKNCIQNNPEKSSLF